MLKMRTIIMLALIAMSLAFVGCGRRPAGNFGEVADAVGVYPREIQRLLNNEFRESITAVGMATASDRLAALRRARFNATQQIAEQFQSEVASQQRAFTLDMQGNVEQDVFETVQEIFVMTTLNGDRVITEMVSQGRDGYTAFVLRALDANVLKQLLEAQANAAALREARTAWGNLEERVARERAARAGTPYAQ